MIPTGYQTRLIGTANSLDELNMFVPLEEGLPELSRVLLQVAVSPDADIQTIAGELNAKCLEQGVPQWPEYPGQIVFIQDNTLYLAWTKGIAWLPIIIGLLVAIPFIAPIILLFVSPTFRAIVEFIPTLLLMFVLMIFMRKMSEAMVGPPKPKKELPPLVDRLEARLMKISGSIAGLRRELAGISDIVSETRALATEAAGVFVTPAERERLAGKAARAESEVERKLREYKAALTPEQMAKLEEARRLVREIKETWEE